MECGDEKTSDLVLALRSEGASVVLILLVVVGVIAVVLDVEVADEAGKDKDPVVTVHRQFAFGHVPVAVGGAQRLGVVPARLVQPRGQHEVAAATKQKKESVRVVNVRIGYRFHSQESLDTLF